MAQKIAILGGGVGAVSAAFALTDQPGWQTNYDITVYQMGWRLGGKGASGRNKDKRDRIEEHGLHIWMGMYENAFHLMQKCYAALARPPVHPLATWTQAFKKHNFCTMMEQVQDNWVSWSFNVPPNDGVPGQGGVCLSIKNIIDRIIEWLFHTHMASQFSLLGDGAILLLHVARTAADTLTHDALTRTPALAQPVVDALEEYRRLQHHSLWGFGTSWDTDMRRRFILMDLAVTLIRGLIADQVTDSFDKLDQYDFREWLCLHGASPTSVWSAPIRCIYELVFAYVKGNTDFPQLGAGAALRFVLRSIFTYQGAFIWFMQAGMGDVVFAPLYLVLQQRGVKFKFFHRVDNLGLSADQQSVETISMSRQATMKAGDYSPLVSVKGLECWPNEPLADQFIDSERLQYEHFRTLGVEVFESAWSPWVNPQPLTLRKGVDFDLIVLGISLGALKYVCPELVAASPAWKNMVEKVQTVQTQAFQLWLNRSAMDLGWTNVPEPAILDSYRDSWADFSHLIGVENWPPSDCVRSIAYFCNTLQDAPTVPDPSTDPSFQTAQKQRVKVLSLQYLKTGLTAPLWPLAVNPANPQELDWTVLVDPTNGTGEQRFDYQFWRDNIDPTERYVQSIPNTTQYRLKADQSGFTNLFLAGDWIKTGIDAGCVEAAVMGGLQASRALSGYPAAIFGETDFCTSVEADLSAPAYVVRGGEQVLSQPVSLTNVDFYSFLLDAQLQALQELCDRYLNLPRQNRVHYQAFLPFVLLSVANIGRVQSQIPADRDKGWASEIDASFWVPLIAVGAPGGGWAPLRMVWFQPYLFVDNAWAVAAGREIYGFAKEAATFPSPNAWQFHLPRDANSPPGAPEPTFRVNTLAIKHYDPNAQALPATVLEVSRDGASPGGLAKNYQNAGEIMADFLGVLAPVPMVASFPALGQVPLVFLKEFRDATDGSLACYQQIVEAMAQVTKIGALGSLAGPYKVTIPAFDSHPMASELGLAPAGSPDPVVLTASRAWYMNFDFEVGNGVIV